MTEYEIVTLAGAATIGALLQLLAHYIEKPKEPRLLMRYFLGTGILFVTFAFWRAFNNDWWTALGLAAIDGLSGIAVAAAYGWDAMVGRIRQAKMVEEADDELQD